MFFFLVWNDSILQYITDYINTIAEGKSGKEYRLSQ